ncbi:MAG TPA: adenylate kinase [Synergistaceae bacterium]|jgi:adenylate kinase|nr:adenylate kinase [Synergistaceae bacterium]
MRIILLGAPGAGKGTLAEQIKAKHPVAHISTGDILRANVRNGTPLGTQAKGYMDSGRLVPDDLIIAMMKERLGEKDCSEGFILDGFPRTIPQAEALERILSELKLSVDGVVLLEIDDETVVKRLSNRRVCRSCGAIYNVLYKPSKKGNRCEICGGELYQRDDDTESVIRGRLKVYHDQTAPLIAFYDKKGMLLRLSQTDGAESLSEALDRMLRERKA